MNTAEDMKIDFRNIIQPSLLRFIMVKTYITVNAVTAVLSF